DPRRIRLARQTSRDKTDRHFRFLVFEARQVLDVPERRPQLKAYVFAGEKLAISLAELPVGASLGASRHDHVARRERMPHDENRPGEGSQDQQPRRYDEKDRTLPGEVSHLAPRLMLVLYRI